MGQLGTGWLRRCLVLYKKPGAVRPPTSSATDARAHRIIGRASEPRLQPRHVDITGRQFLVGRGDDAGWHTKAQHSPNQLATGSHGCIPRFQTQLDQSQLQRWYVHTLWRQLSERLFRMAIFLVRSAIVEESVATPRPAGKNRYVRGTYCDSRNNLQVTFMSMS